MEVCPKSKGGQITSAIRSICGSFVYLPYVRVIMAFTCSLWNDILRFLGIGTSDRIKIISYI